MRNKLIQATTTKEEFTILDNAAILSGLRLSSFIRSSSIEKARLIIKKNKEVSA